MFLDAWELVADDLIAVRLQEGLSGAGAVVFVVSPESVGRGWINEEFAAAVAAAAGPARLTITSNEVVFSTATEVARHRPAGLDSRARPVLTEVERGRARPGMVPLRAAGVAMGAGLHAGWCRPVPRWDGVSWTGKQERR